MNEMSEEKPYTVIGFYWDNRQPWVAHETAVGPEKAARAAAGSMIVDDFSAGENGDNLLVVEVLEGHHHGVLGNDKAISGSELVGATTDETDEEDTDLCDLGGHVVSAFQVSRTREDGETMCDDCAEWYDSHPDEYDDADRDDRDPLAEDTLLNSEAMNNPLAFSEADDTEAAD